MDNSYALNNPTLADPSQYINPYVKIGQHSVQDQKTVKIENYKTVMCQSFLESMKCSYGDNCKFAHGEHELRQAKTPIRNHLKYKTKLCEKYTKGGICPYGSRCLFIHPDPPMNPNLPHKVVAPTTAPSAVSPGVFHSIWSTQNVPQPPQTQQFSCGCKIVVGCPMHKTVSLFEHPVDPLSSNPSCHYRMPAACSVVGCATHRTCSNILPVESLYQRDTVETLSQKFLNDRIVGSGQKRLSG